jgi:hypothetical protein
MSDQDLSTAPTASSNTKKVVKKEAKEAAAHVASLGTTPKTRDVQTLVRSRRPSLQSL